MRKFLVSMEFFMPIAVICSTLFFLATLGYLLFEHGAEHHRFKGLLIIIFSSIMFVVLIFVARRFYKRKKALTDVRKIHRLFETEKPAIITEKLQNIIADAKLPDLHNVLHFLLARSYQKQQKKSEAKKAYQVADAFWLAHNNLAVMFIAEENYDSAVKHLRKSIALNQFEEFL